MSDYGLQSYLETSKQIGERRQQAWALVLVRMLLAKAWHGLSAQEYGLFGLDREPWSKLGGYMTKKQTTALFARINPPDQRSLVEDKLAFHRHCMKMDLPVPRLHALICRNPAHDVDDVEVLRGFTELLQRFCDQAEIRLILKPRRDALGTGVRLVNLRSGVPFDINERRIDQGTFEHQLQADMVRDDYLVQAFVAPHPTTAAWGSGKALGTLRIATFLSERGVQLLYALVRIPTGDNVHDNFSGGNSGNLIACVDLRAGHLMRVFGRRDARFNHLVDSFDANPDSGQLLAGQAIPAWTEIVELVRRAAEAFPTLSLLGWDIAPSAQGPLIIEANSNPDIVGAQVSCGRGARELLRPLLE